MMRRAATLGALTLWFAGWAAAAEPSRPGVTLTIYNGNYAMVKDVRQFELTRGAQVVRFREVAASIDPTSVAFRSLTDPGTTVLEQNYEYDLVSADKLLSKYIDKDLTIITKDGKVYRGVLLSFDGGQLVLKLRDGKVVMVARANNVQTIEFGSLPEGLITRPTLVWKVWARRAGRHLMEVAYLANNINWRADYTAVVNQAETAMDFAGWVTITNRSGARYKEARIKLIAGEVHRVAPPRPIYRGARKWALKAAVDRAAFEEKAFAEYHMYTLSRTTTINDNQVKQIELIEPARKVPIRKFYQYTGGKKIAVKIEVRNSKESKLGIPLPKGRVRVYKKDEADGSLEFIGEDRIDHTPKDEKFTLFLGYAFDLVGETKVLKDVSISRRSRRRTVQIKLRNHKNIDVEIEVLQRLGANWEIESSSHKWTRKDAYTVKFPVPVERGGEAVLTYTVRTWW